MVVFEAALLVAGLGAGLAGGYTLASRRDSQPAGVEATTDELGDSRYQTVADNFPKGSVALFGEDLEFQLATGGVFDYIDFGPEEFEGHAIADIFVESFVEEHLDDYRAVFAGEESSFEMRHGGRFYRKHLVPVTDDSGDIVAGVEMTRDITELHERERELQRQNDRLEEFASIVSHDLRNPLTVALGRVELIEGAENDEHVESIQSALGRMTALIDDMLTLARQGRTVENPERIALATTATDAWAHVESDNATLVNDLETTVTGDPSRVMQLFENLFRNAVEHGSTNSRTQSDDAIEHGSTDVTVTVGTTPNGFYVADDGPGIPESDREAVFEHGHTTNEEGTGFGLAIVENVASAHGWSISVTDSDTGGARFEFDTGAGPASEAEPVELTNGN